MEGRVGSELAGPMMATQRLDGIIAKQACKAQCLSLTLSFSLINKMSQVKLRHHNHGGHSYLNYLPRKSLRG